MVWGTSLKRSSQHEPTKVMAAKDLLRYAQSASRAGTILLLNRWLRVALFGSSAKLYRISPQMFRYIHKILNID
jgi:hypothetical protein